MKSLKPKSVVITGSSMGIGRAVATRLASELAKGVTGQVFCGSGGYVGRFLANEQLVVETMDSKSGPPWEMEALAEALLK
jgi:NAD(P)-dependent dehydrogenase (short-subunit alcohol dehydrogenase family)